MRKRVLLAFLLAAALFIVPIPGQPTVTVNAAETVQEAVGIHVAYHTQQEILDRIRQDGLTMSAPLTFAEDPVVTAPYSAGSLSQDTLDKALAMLNQIRYIAGLQDNVTLSAEYNELTQAAALVNYVNNELTHYPEQPTDMEKALYDQGAEGASRSNIAWASWAGRSLHPTIVDGWMNDGDAYNVDRVGHRRWILHPKMGATGFGAVSGGNGTYSAMYSLDFGGAGDEYGVAWPAQNMPVDYFEKDYPWSISMGSSVDESAVKVTLTRTSDSKVWTFASAASDGTFYVNNDGYGQTGCIIFRPDDIEGYSAGDSFRVTIEGLSTPVSYTVNFFNEESANSGNQGGGTEQPGNSGNQGGGTEQPGDNGNQGGGTEQPGDNGNQGGGTEQPGNSGNQGGNQGGGTEQPGNSGNQGGGTEQPGNSGNQGGGTEQPGDNGNQGGGTQQPGNSGNQGGNQGGGTEQPGNSGNQGGNQGGGTEQPGNSGNQGGSTGQPAGVSNGSAPVSNVIINVDWNAVNTEVAQTVQNADQQNVEVQAGDQFELPASLLNTLQGKDTTLMLHTGKGVTFSVTGTDVKSQNAGLKMTMLTSVDIPANVKQTVLKDAQADIEFGTQEEGAYPFDVNVHVNLGKTNAGKKAYLYIYDGSAGAMRLVSSFTATEAGRAMFGIRSGGKYVVVVAEKEAAGTVRSKSYTVQPGDTFFRIAANNGLSVQDLMKANPQIKNINVIRPGWVINLQ